MKKVLFLLLTLCIWSCGNDNTPPILKKHNSTISAEGTSIEVKGNYQFLICGIKEETKEGTIDIFNYDIEDPEKHVGEWYRITIDYVNKKMLIEVDENQTGEKRRLAIRVSQQVRFDTYVMTQEP